MAVCAVRAVDLASASRALSLWAKNDGIAIAARMPMISITTRSSTRVKPSSRPIRFLRFSNISYLLGTNPHWSQSPFASQPIGVLLNPWCGPADSFVSSGVP